VAQSTKTSNELEFLSAVNSTTMLVKQLLEDIREGEVNFAIIKTELTSVLTKVKELSSLVRDSEGDLSELNTRVALLERAVLELESWVKQQREQGSTVLIANTQGRWQVITAITTGGLGLIAAIIALMMNIIK